MCNCDSGSPCGGSGGSGASAGSSPASQALITAEVDAYETPQPEANGQGQRWVFSKPGAFSPGFRAGQA